MNLELSDQTVLITGASGGIGQALASVFADEGARLVLHAGSRLAELQRWTATQPWADRAHCVAADLRDPDAVDAAFAEGRHRFGRVDAVVANAGVWPAPIERLHEASVARIRHTIEVDLLGAMWTARSWMAGLATQGPRPDGIGASLTFIGSTAGRFGEAGHADYAAAKAGLRGLVASLKNEVVHLDPYARVNLVEPGWTVTPMVREELAVPGAIAAVVRTMPLQQIARAVDVARTVAALASPAVSRHTTGEVITVAGGMEGRVQWTPDQIDEDAVKRRL